MFTLGVELNSYGYYELSEKPSETALRDYYEKKYYQQLVRMHEKSYTEDEINYRNNKLTQKYITVERMRDRPFSKESSFLDIGCGEGFALDFFAQKGWDITGADYSTQGCANHHPHLLEKLIAGDLQNTIQVLLEGEKKFDVILLDNVLEHLLDAEGMLNNIAKLVAPNGILIVEVPNDFSEMQKRLFEKNHIQRNYWVVTPDHISYFNRRGLRNLMEACGFIEVKVQGDFPIDFFLFNENTNYILNPNVGKSCHAARLEVENLLHNLSASGAIEMYEAMGKMGIGRQITGFYQLSKISAEGNPI